MSTLLFIAPADLGEAVLATGALEQALLSGAEATIVCGADAADLFRAVPGLKRLLTVAADAGPATWMALGAEVMGQRYDIVVDARGVMLGRLAPARTHVLKRDSTTLRHRVDEWSDWMEAARPLAPRLWLDDRARETAAAIAPDTAPLLVLAPGGANGDKRWPRERFAAVARRLAGGALSGARIAVLGAAPRDAAVTRDIVVSLEGDGVAAADLGQGLDLLAGAALMERATLVIGNDNALTHIAAAAGAPTLTLFGPTDERVRAPYGPRTRTLRGRAFADIAAMPTLDQGAAMDDVSIDAVEAAALELLHAGGLR